MKQRIPKSLQGTNQRLVELSCAECGDPFMVIAGLAHRYGTCSQDCTSRHRQVAKVGLSCAWCDEVFWVLPGHNRRNRSFCANSCRISALNAMERALRDPMLSKRQVTKKGYVRIADNGRQVMEHRFVMELHLGRSLRPEERVHHLNGDRRDNRISNLVLYPNHSEHIRDAHPNMVKNLPGR